MTLLSCGSPVEAVQTLSDIFRISPMELRRRWRTFNYDDQRFRQLAFEDALIQHLGFDSARDLPQPTAIRWFHATRTLPDADFKETGILPTRAALPRIWSVLETVAVQSGIGRAVWRTFQEGFWSSHTAGSSQFSRKFLSPGWEGPFAFLVRAAAVDGGDAGHRDFTRISEAAEDILMSFEELHGVALRDAVIAATKPCLVVFIAADSWHGAVQAAISYAYRADVGMDQSIHSNTCFSGEGQAVPPEWIERVEWL
jgi:hypothetical protein